MEFSEQVKKRALRIILPIMLTVRIFGSAKGQEYTFNHNSQMETGDWK